MATIFEAGYSGIHFLPFHKSGESGSSYSITDFNALEPELQCLSNFILPPNGENNDVSQEQREENEKWIIVRKRIC